MPLKLKNIDGLLCNSPASTAICSSMVRSGTKPLHRLNSYVADHYKTLTTNYSPSRAPCISELPITPRPFNRSKTHKISSLNHNNSDDVIATSRRKSSADCSDLKKYSYDSYNGSYSPPPGYSSRYLLGDSPFLDSLSESETPPVIKSHERRLISTNRSDTRPLASLLDAEKKKKTPLALVNLSDKQVVKSKNDQDNIQRQKSVGYCKNDSLVLKSSSSARSRDQVVVVKVSLHCKCRGCEAKLRKHLSKMEGVKSFSIDLETKKVIVIGNVSPIGVLTSISKVKNAQFWPSPTPTSSSTSSSSSSSSSTSSTTSGVERMY